MFSSTNSQPKILALPVTTVAVAILVILSTVSPTTGWPWDLPTYHVHIISTLRGNKQLYVHCRCTHDYRPKASVKAGAEYEWRFKAHFRKTTRWECYLAPDSIRRNFIVVYDDKNHTKTYDNNVYWVAKEDGIYNRDPQGTDTFTYEWLRK
ncbi:hypothetical protein LINPERPRIM_LOCUS26870 [Linum perenne]